MSVIGFYLSIQTLLFKAVCTRSECVRLCMQVWVQLCDCVGGFSGQRLKATWGEVQAPFIIFSKRFMSNLPLWISRAWKWEQVISAMDLALESIGQQPLHPHRTLHMWWVTQTDIYTNSCISFLSVSMNSRRIRTLNSHYRLWSFLRDLGMLLCQSCKLVSSFIKEFACIQGFHFSHTHLNLHINTYPHFWSFSKTLPSYCALFQPYTESQRDSQWDTLTRKCNYNIIKW